MEQGGGAGGAAEGYRRGIDYLSLSLSHALAASLTHTITHSHTHTLTHSHTLTPDGEQGGGAGGAAQGYRRGIGDVHYRDVRGHRVRSRERTGYWGEYVYIDIYDFMNIYTHICISIYLSIYLYIYIYNT